jgi:hypothetical protein
MLLSTDLWNRFAPYLEPDDGGTSGGGASDTARADDDDASDDDSGEQSDDDAEEDADDDASADAPPTLSPEQAFEKLMKRFNGDAHAAAEHLFRQGYRTRVRLRLKTDEVKDLQRQLPKNGRYLTKKDAQVFDQYRALKLSPQQISARLGEHATLQQQVAAQTRESTLRDVAETESAKFSVLRELGKDLTYEIKEVDGVRTAYVRVTGADNTVALKPLREYAEETWPDFTVALFPDGGDTANRGRRTFTRQPGPSDRKNGTATSDIKGTAQNYVRTRYARPGKKQEQNA